jgi:hypothetical protein
MQFQSKHCIDGYNKMSTERHPVQCIKEEPSMNVLLATVLALAKSKHVSQYHSSFQP